MRYLQNKDIFQKYRVVSDYDKTVNDYPRDENGVLDSSFDDIYIKCKQGNMIYNYGHGVLVAYIPSLIRGNRLLKQIDNSHIFDIEITDEEVLFKFKVKYLDEVATLLKARVNTLDEEGKYHYISPFSTSGLKKIKVNIPEDKILVYKEIVAKIPEKDRLIIGRINNDFLNTLVNKKFTKENLKSDMKLKAASGKDYIYLIGKFDDYLKYINAKVVELYV